MKKFDFTAKLSKENFDQVLGEIKSVAGVGSDITIEITHPEVGTGITEATNVTFYKGSCEETGEPIIKAITNENEDIEILLGDIITISGNKIESERRVAFEGYATKEVYTVTRKE